MKKRKKEDETDYEESDQDKGDEDEDEDEDEDDDDHDDNKTALELNKHKQSIGLRGKLCFKCNVKFDAEERHTKNLIGLAVKPGIVENVVANHD